MISELSPLQSLELFASANRFHGKGPLSVALVITDQAKEKSFPLDPETLIAESGTQVAGLGVASVQAILRRNGIHKVLAKEGGRTSRGSVAKMRKFVEFLNEIAQVEKPDLELIERFWIKRVEGFFAGQPFTVKLDPSKGLRAVVRDVASKQSSAKKNRRG